MKASPFSVRRANSLIPTLRSERVLCACSDHQANPEQEDSSSPRTRLVDIYGPGVDPACDVVEYEYPDGSGSWIQCAPEDLLQVAEHFRGQGCLVWVNGEDNA
jgi:hypothetical protein